MCFLIQIKQNNKKEAHITFPLPPSRGSRYTFLAEKVKTELLTLKYIQVDFNSYNDESRREELIRMIEHSVQQLSVGELEALYYDMVAKDYIK